MVISDLNYLEICDQKSCKNLKQISEIIEGGQFDFFNLNYEFNQNNAVVVYQTATATAYNGTAIASTYSSIVVGNYINSLVNG